MCKAAELVWQIERNRQRLNAFLEQQDEMDVMKVYGISIELAKSVMSLAHSLGFYVTVEGVETIEQYNCLRESKCDRIQGYLFSKPLPADEVLKFLESGIMLIKNVVQSPMMVVN